MSNKFKRFLLIFLFMLVTVRLYGQEKPEETASIIGKLIETKEFSGDKGERLFFVTIENIKKEKEVILTISDTKFWIGKQEVELNAIKEGSIVTIDYKIEPNGGKVAVWIYMDDGKEENKKEDTTKLKEEKEEERSE